jgi:hypothetical protein
VVAGTASSNVFGATAGGAGGAVFGQAGQGAAAGAIGGVVAGLMPALRVALGLADTDTTLDNAVSFYCSLVEKLSDSVKALWSRCTRRVVDIAFESGTEPESHTYQIPESLVRRVTIFGISIAITIYRVGAYSAPPGE